MALLSGPAPDEVNRFAWLRPASALGRAQLSLLSLVRAQTAAGITAVAALHDLNIAAAYADSVIVLSEGRVVAAGPAASVLTGELISEVYGVRADVLAHPRTGRPLIAFDTT